MYLSRRSGRTCDKSRSQNALFLLQRLGRDGFMEGDRALATRFDQFAILCLPLPSFVPEDWHWAGIPFVGVAHIRLMRNLLGL